MRNIKEQISEVNRRREIYADIKRLRKKIIGEIGIVVTLLCQHYKKYKEKEQDI